MKLLLLTLYMTIIVSCTKNKKPCYECEHVTNGVIVKQDVCTDGDPKAGLPTQNANGQIGWSCKEK